MLKLIVGLALAALTITTGHAQMVEKADLNFSINYNALKAGEVHYAFSLMKPTDVSAEIAGIDTVNLLAIPHSRILYNKIAYIVKKPVQTFNYQHVTDVNEMDRTMPHANVSKSAELSFDVRVRGLFGYRYKMQMEYDSEIVSTVNDAAIIEAIDRARRLDGTLGQADSTIYRHIYDFTKYSNAGVSITRHYDLDGEATLVITTNLSSVKATFAIESIIKPSFITETENSIKLIRQ